MQLGTIGIIGAGKLGITLAQLALKASYQVVMSASGDPEDIRLTVEVLAPGATVMTNEAVAHQADIVVLALPLGKVYQLEPGHFAGKLVVDGTNYWWEIDGPREDILPDAQSSSEMVQQHLLGARVVKALSHMGYHNLHDEAREKSQGARKAIAIAGDEPRDVSLVSELVDRLGFDPVPIGSLVAGRQLEPGSAVFGANVEAAELLALLAKNK